MASSVCDGEVRAASGLCLEAGWNGAIIMAANIWSLYRRGTTHPDFRRKCSLQNLVVGVGLQENQGTIVFWTSSVACSSMAKFHTIVGGSRWTPYQATSGEIAACVAGRV